MKVDAIDFEKSLKENNEEVLEFFENNKDKFDMTDVIKIYCEVMQSIPSPSSDLDGVPQYFSCMNEVLNGIIDVKTCAILFKSEGILKHFLSVLDPKWYVTRTANVDNSNTNDLMFSEVTKKLRINPENKNYKSYDKPNGNDVIYHLSVVYNSRNMDAHLIKKLSQMKRLRIIYSVLIVQLAVISLHRKDFLQVIKHVDTYDYNKVIDHFVFERINLYEEKNKDFHYIRTEFSGGEDGDIERKSVFSGNVDTLVELLKDKKTSRIRLLGNAGMGKTKMLEYMEYSLLKERQNNANSFFPIFIRCVDLNSSRYTNDPVKNYITDSLREYHDRPEVLFSDIRKKEKVVLIIDGLNEILDVNTKRAFITNLQQLLDNDARLGMIISERYSHNNNSIGRQYAEIVTMQPLSEKLVLDFLKQYLSDETKHHYITDLFNQQDDSEASTYLTVPYYLSRAIELLKCRDGVLPDNKMDLVRIFLQMILEREFDKGEGAAIYDYVVVFLAAILDAYEDTNNAKYAKKINATTALADKTKELMLSPDNFSSDHLLSLFEELNLISVVGSNIYMDELLENFIILEV